MASATREKPTRSLDLETGSNSSSGAPYPKKSTEAGPSEDTKTASSLAGEQGEEINYHTLTWW